MPTGEGCLLNFFVRFSPTVLLSERRRNSSDNCTHTYNISTDYLNKSYIFLKLKSLDALCIEYFTVVLFMRPALPAVICITPSTSSFFFRSPERQTVHIPRRSYGRVRRSLFRRTHRRHTLVRRPIFKRQLHRPKQIRTAVAARTDRRTSCLRYDIYRTQERRVSIAAARSSVTNY